VAQHPGNERRSQTADPARITTAPTTAARGQHTGRNHSARAPSRHAEDGDAYRTTANWATWRCISCPYNRGPLGGITPRRSAVRTASRRAGFEQVSRGTPLHRPRASAARLLVGVSRRMTTGMREPAATRCLMRSRPPFGHPHIEHHAAIHLDGRLQEGFRQSNVSTEAYGHQQIPEERRSDASSSRCRPPPRRACACVMAVFGIGQSRVRQCCLRDGGRLPYFRRVRHRRRARPAPL